MKTTTSKPTILRAKIRFTQMPNGSGFYVTDSNKGRRCTASILHAGSRGWHVRIDKGGVAGWKYAAFIPTATAEAAYEYCHEFGTRVEDE
jgi:hypothetical protein